MLGWRRCVVLVVVVGADLAGAWFCLDLSCDFGWCFIMLWLYVLLWLFVVV